MKIDFMQPLLSLKGEPLQHQGAPFLLVHACQEALISTFTDEQPAAAEKVARFALALKISAPLPPDVTPEEVVKLRELVAKAYGPLVTGRAYELLDAKPDKE